MISAINQRCRREVHPLAHELRESFDAELQLLIALGIDGEERHLPRFTVGPDHHIRTGRPSQGSGSLALNSVSNFGSGLNWLHRLTHATGRDRYAIR